MQQADFNLCRPRAPVLELCRPVADQPPLPASRASGPRRMHENSGASIRKQNSLLQLWCCSHLPTSSERL